MRIYLCIFILFLKTASIFGAAIDSLHAEPDNKFLILPFGFYTNETSLALGVFSQYKTENNFNIFGNAFYTFKNQFMFFAITDFNSENIYVYNTFKTKDYYSDFYGFGNESQQDNPADYRYFQIDNYFEAGKKTGQKTFISAAVNNFYHIPKDRKELFGYDREKYDHLANGIGFSIKYYDVSDKFFRDGISIRSSFLFYPEFLGSWEQFSVFDSEAVFFTSFNQSALNTLVSGRFTFGEVHPEKLSFIGGSRILRGYPEMRFIDKNQIAVQTQYDFRLYKSISACLFIGTGDVFGEFSDLSVRNIKTAYGAGLIYEYRNLIMRVEAATSPEKNFEIIITGNRAF